MGRRDWLFTGGALSIDFVNTLRERWSTRPRDTIADDQELAEWMRSAGLPLSSAEDGAGAPRGLPPPRCAGGALRAQGRA
ncbi:ABATE domain-containing protein [Saccharomonospora cyanea]|uniref:ABATE domain-containing protein n=1 Tax=Saccharomonospora cyanea TaxID=40989 RepID=UPI000A0250A8